MFLYKIIVTWLSLSLNLSYKALPYESECGWHLLLIHQFNTKMSRLQSVFERESRS